MTKEEILEVIASLRTKKEEIQKLRRILRKERKKEKTT